MKILSIRLKNLHSLRGEWHIPFTENPLRGAGIFAITGPTGAGKSTILDAVTLALYGKVPRNSEKGEVMSHHTGECWAEVDFETAAGQYRARWSLARARQKANGKMQEPEMTLAHLPSGQILHSKIREVVSEVENLIGLDFARFTQSVLLSQGEFAKFLKADSNERADLLERITGTHIYADLSKKCYEIAKEKLADVERVKAGLRTGLLSDEEVQQVNQQLQQIRKQSAELAEQAQTLQKQKQWLLQIQQLQQQITQTKQQQQELEEQTAQLQPQLQRLQRHEQALQFAPELAQWKQELNAVEGLEKTKKELTESNIVLANELRKITEDEKKLKQQFESAQNLLQQQQPLITQTIELDVELKQVEKALADIQNQWQETTGKLNRHHEQLLQNQATAQQQQQQLQQLTAFLENNRPDEGLVAALPLLQEQLSNITQMNGQLAQQEQKKLKAQQELQQCANQIAQLGTQLQKQQLQVIQNANQLQQTEAELTKYPPLQALNGLIPEIEKRGMNLKRQKQLSETYLEQCGILEKLREEFTTLQQQIKEKEEALRHTIALHLEAEAHQGSIERQLQAERMAAKYEQDRLTLVSGQPCPLCGSTEHPFAHSHTAVEISKTEAQLKEQQQKVKNLETEKNNLEKNISLLKQQCEQTEKNGKTKKTELEEQVVKEFNQLNAELNAQHNINTPLVFEHLLTEKRQELQTVKKQIDMSEQAEKKLQEIKEQLGKVREQVLKIQAGVQLAEQKAANAQKDLSDAQAAIKEQQQNINQRNAQTNALLQPYGKQLPGNAAQITGLIQQLQQRAELYQNKKEEVNNLQTQMAAVSSAIEGLQKNVAETQKSLTGIETRKAEQQNRVTQLQTKRQNLTATFVEKDPQQEKMRLETERDNAGAAYQQIREEHTQKGERLNMQKNLLHQSSEELERNTELLQYTETELMGKIQTAGFQTLLMLDESLITNAQEVTQIRAVEQNIKQQTEQLKGSLKSAETTLQTTLALQLTTQTPEEINLQLEETQTQKQAADQSTGQLTQQLEQDKTLKAENKTLLAEIEKLQAEHTRWKKLSAIIGSASGQEFKRFAQDITLQQLILQANRHLRKLNDRYQIRKKTDKELEMEIIDMYQANVSRSVNTLSGGEGFLVSLALALGLSDLAGRKTKIESLFIDEGFGTLDTGTLDIAITTLENLQAQGKMIGVISHVEMLKERITTQIQVHKRSNGVSEITIQAVSHFS